MTSILRYRAKQSLWSRIFPARGAAARDLRKGDKFTSPAGNVCEVQWANFLPEEGMISDGERTAIVFGVAWQCGEHQGVMKVHPSARFTTI